MTRGDNLPSNKQDINIEFTDDIHDEICISIAEVLPAIVAQVMPECVISRTSVRQYGGGFTHGSARVPAGGGYLVTNTCTHGEEQVRIHQPTPYTWRGQRIPLTRT